MLLWETAVAVEAMVAAMLEQVRDMVQVAVVLEDIRATYQVRAGVLAADLLETGRYQEIVQVQVALVAVVAPHIALVTAAQVMAVVAAVLVFTAKGHQASREILRTAHRHLQEQAVLREAKEDFPQQQ